VHMMVQQPENLVPDFAAAGADLLVVHAEACPHLHRNLQQIRDLGKKAGVALNPSTPLSAVEHVLEMMDLLVIMSVNPGFGGQKFIENTYQKISRLKELILKKNSNALIEVDGGVNLENAPKLVKQGADVLVSGNTIFASQNPLKVIGELKTFFI